MPTDDRDKRRDYRTPPQGVPRPVDPRDEQSVPIVVDHPSQSRTRTDSSPPYMTVQELARDVTLRRKQHERELAHVVKRVDAISDRIAELQEAKAITEVHLTTVRDSLGEFASIAEFRETVVTRLTDVTGKDGTNGKLGALKARVDQAEARKFSLFMWALGLLTAAGAVVFWAGSTVAGLRTSVDHLKADVTDLRVRAHPGSGSGAMHRSPSPSSEPAP